MKKKKEVEIHIVLPERATTDIDDGLCQLTEALDKAGVSAAHALLGGEWGYGAEYENDVFMMHPYCWCEEKGCKWCAIDEDGVPGDGLPNFHYKPTDCKIWWYKWIGRSQKKTGKLPKDWLKKCSESIKL